MTENRTEEGTVARPYRTYDPRDLSAGPQAGNLGDMLKDYPFKITIPAAPEKSEAKPYDGSHDRSRGYRSRLEEYRCRVGAADLPPSQRSALDDVLRILSGKQAGCWRWSDRVARLEERVRSYERQMAGEECSSASDDKEESGKPYNPAIPEEISDLAHIVENHTYLRRKYPALRMKASQILYGLKMGEGEKKRSKAKDSHEPRPQTYSSVSENSARKKIRAKLIRSSIQGKKPITAGAEDHR